MAAILLILLFGWLEVRTLPSEDELEAHIKPTELLADFPKESVQRIVDGIPQEYSKAVPWLEGNQLGAGSFFHPDKALFVLSDDHRQRALREAPKVYWRPGSEFQARTLEDIRYVVWIHFGVTSRPSGYVRMPGRMMLYESTYYAIAVVMAYPSGERVAHRIFTGIREHRRAGDPHEKLRKKALSWYDGGAQ